jgi:hypothetical protein
LTPYLFLLSYALGLVATCARPVVGIYLYVAVYFVNPLSRWWGGSLPSLRYSFIIAVVCLVSFVLHGHLDRLKQALAHPLMAAWGTLVAWQYAVTIWAIYPAAHSRYALLMLTVFVIGTVTVCLVDTMQKLRWLLTTFVVGAGYIGYLGWTVGRGSTGRLEGIGTADASDANDIAAMIAAICPVLVYMALFGRGAQRIAAIVVMPFVLNVLVLFNSRGAFIGLFVGGAVFLFAVLRDRTVSKAIRRQIYGGIVLAALAFGYLADTAFWERMGTIQAERNEVSGELEREGSSESRLFFWQIGLKISPELPFGGGLHAFGVHARKHLPEKWRGGANSARAAHSTWIEVLTELGFPGALIYLALIFIVFRVGSRIKKQAASQEIGTAALLVSALLSATVICIVTFTFLSRLHAEILFWIYILVACLDRIVHTTDTETASKPVTNTANQDRDASSPRRPSIYWKR